MPEASTDRPARLLVGMEPDPVTRHLIELYAGPLGYALRWVESLEGWPGPHAGAVAFLLSAHALPEMDATAVAQVAQRLGGVPLLGLAGERRRFPQECVPRPIRQVLRKPVRAADLMAALEALLAPLPASESDGALDGFRAMVEEMQMDADMVAGLCRSFIERGEQYLLEAMAATDPRDDETLDRIGHAFKGMAGNMRLKRMTELSDALRRAAKEHTGDVEALTRGLQVEFGALRGLLQAGWLKAPSDP
jgi:HPt (histidine-containing phosphotransfer) domain-containing protein